MCLDNFITLFVFFLQYFSSVFLLQYFFLPWSVPVWALRFLVLVQLYRVKTRVVPTVTLTPAVASALTLTKSSKLWCCSHFCNICVCTIISVRVGQSDRISVSVAHMFNITTLAAFQDSGKRYTRTPFMLFLNCSWFRVKTRACNSLLIWACWIWS